jgi:hypothetical protein
MSLLPMRYHHTGAEIVGVSNGGDTSFSTTVSRPSTSLSSIGSMMMLAADAPDGI